MSTFSTPLAAPLNAAYITNIKKIEKNKKIKKKRNRRQHNTDDGRQAVGEEMRHVQMSR